MGKTQVKICMGTMCYVMGGGELRSLVETLPEEMRRCLDVSYSPCLGHCNQMLEPPYIEINGRVVAGVSAPALLQIIKEELNDVV